MQAGRSYHEHKPEWIRDFHSYQVLADSLIGISLSVLLYFFTWRIGFSVFGIFWLFLVSFGQALLLRYPPFGFGNGIVGLPFIFHCRTRQLESLLSRGLVPTSIKKVGIINFVGSFTPSSFVD